MDKEFKLPNPKLLEPVPKDMGDALLRDLISILPIIGDIFNFVEAIEAFRNKKTEAGLLYLLQALPGPELPLTHVIVYEMEKRGELK